MFTYNVPLKVSMFFKFGLLYWQEYISAKKSAKIKY